MFQDGLQCNSSLLVFEELRQKSCGEGRAHIRNHISDDAFQQVHVTDLVPLHNVFELDRVEQVMKVELGRSIGAPCLLISQFCQRLHRRDEG